MTRAKKVLLVVMKVTLPVELVNFFLFMPPLDVGLPENAPWYSKLLFYQWGALHFPGIHLMNGIDPYYKVLPLDLFVWFLSGYIETALLILGVYLLAGRIRRQLRPRSSEAL
jgi:hypothetical protein